MSQNRTILTDYIQGIKTERNFCLNPNASKNVNNVTDADSIVTRDTVDTMDGVSSFAINADASAEKALFLGSPFTKAVQGGNCEARFKYFGDASLYKAYVQLDTAVVSGEDQLLNVTPGSQEMSINFVCGTSASDVPALVIEATDNAAAEFNLGEIYIGPATNIGSAAQAEAVISLSRASQSILTTAATVLSGTPTYAVNAGGETSGVYTVEKPGNYNVILRARIDEVVSGTITFAVQKNNVSISGCNSMDDAPTSNNNQIINCTFSAAAGDTLRVVSSTSADSSYSVNVRSYQITRFPTASEQVFKVGFPGQEWTAFTPTVTLDSGALTNATHYGTWKCEAGGSISVKYETLFTGTSSNYSGIRYGLPPGITPEFLPNGKTLRGGSVRVAGHDTFFGATFLSSSTLNIGAQVYFQGLPDSDSFINITNIDQSMANLNGHVITTEFNNIPITESSPCPRTSTGLFKNGVTTSSAGVERIESARINGACGIASQTGDWISSVTGTGSGSVCTVNIAAGKFSAAPRCQLTAEFAATAASCRLNAAPTTSSVAVACFITTSASGSDSAFHLTCSGPN